MQYMPRQRILRRGITLMVNVGPDELSAGRIAR